MTNEEVIMARFAKKAKGDLHFRSNDWKGDNFLRNVRELRATKSVKDRVLKILLLAEIFNTNNKYNRFQCRFGANRSVEDICRLYHYYFGEFDLFEIMRSLYALVKDNKVATDRCTVIFKQVFWINDDSYREWEHNDINVKADWGVPFKDWNKLGIKEK